MLNRNNAVSDDALEAVSGGTELGNTSIEDDKENNNGEVKDTTELFCFGRCKRKRLFDIYSGGTAYCQTCGWRTFC